MHTELATVPDFTLPRDSRQPGDCERYLAKETVSEQILKRLQEYVAHASDKGLIGKRYPPATSELVMESERQLGFQLNPFLRAVYLDVANGGFGPSYGLVGLPGGATDDQGKTIIDNYKGLSEYFGDLWPNKLVPICHYGCGMLGCVDCSGTDGAMTTWHPGLPPDDINLWWQKNFASEDLSIIDWFTRWLDTTNAADLEHQM